MIDIELIPVIEIANYSEDITTPAKGPYWNYADEWDTYHQLCNAKAGYPDTLIPYKKGSAFYKLSDISDANLSVLVLHHTRAMRNGEYDREQACPFDGGYVLNIAGDDKFFPQCCGDLSDIAYYEMLIGQKSGSFYQGHPSPSVDFEGDMVILNFTVGEFNEHFVPPPHENRISINVEDLKVAINTTKRELEFFTTRIERVNKALGLHIENIDKLLVWGDD